LAILLQQNPELRADETGSSDTVTTVKNWLMQSAVPEEDQSGHDDRYGYGMLNIQALLAQADGS
jgi:hypothetical protein